MTQINDLTKKQIETLREKAFQSDKIYYRFNENYSISVLEIGYSPYQEGLYEEKRYIVGTRGAVNKKTLKTTFVAAKNQNYRNTYRIFIPE